MLTDTEIRKLLNSGELKIDPFIEDFLGPNLYYCHLGNHFLRPTQGGPVNPLKQDMSGEFDKLVTEKEVVLKPGEFILAETFERVGVSEGFLIRLFNSSSLARCGITQAALGMVNPGCGKKSPVRVTLELVNNFPRDVVLTPTRVTDEYIEWGTLCMKIGVLPVSGVTEKSYSEWDKAAYGGDTHVAACKMAGRFPSRTKR